MQNASVPTGISNMYVRRKNTVWVIAGRKRELQQWMQIVYTYNDVLYDGCNKNSHSSLYIFSEHVCQSIISLVFRRLENGEGSLRLRLIFHSRLCVSRCPTLKSVCEDFWTAVEQDVEVFVTDDVGLPCFSILHNFNLFALELEKLCSDIRQRVFLLAVLRD